MLRFDVYRDGRPAEDVDLSGAYVFGQDSIPVRADLALSNSQISCAKRVPGASGLAILWEAPNTGRFLLQTTRLPDRVRPYNLNVEICRAQMMRIAQKIEDWGLFDYPDATGLCMEFDSVRKQFIESLKAPDEGQAAALADQTLGKAITLGEKMALFHADIFLTRRKNSGTSSPRSGLGCMVDPTSSSPAYQDLLRDACDFINVPIRWKNVEPKERQNQYAQIDSWMNWAVQSRKAIHAGPLVSFETSFIPEWLYLWEHDYDALRDMIYEHIQRVTRRYEKQVRAWTVVSGIHAYNSFNLSFEQLMELTRMSCLLMKKLVPRSQAIIELALPWGEYYARNQRTIPPLLYADMAVQSGVKFDAFGLQLYMGIPADGYYVRDLMQISALLDEFVALGKPLHITACQVPGDMVADPSDAFGGKALPSKAGYWHTGWSPRLQAEWLQAFYRIAISKPFVESVAWRDLADSEGHFLPNGGLCRNTLEPKLGYKELRNFRMALQVAPPAAGETAKATKAAKAPARKSRETPE